MESRKTGAEAGAVKDTTGIVDGLSPYRRVGGEAVACLFLAGDADYALGLRSALRADSNCRKPRTRQFLPVGAVKI
jgi:hypothetical protein